MDMRSRRTRRRKHSPRQHLPKAIRCSPSYSLSKLHKPLRPIESCQVSFHDLKPGEYFVRLIVDTDDNAAFTPGDYPDRAPEEVYYYPQEISIKKGFTSEEHWDIRTQSPLGSKPDALRKVKPDEAKKKREDKNIEYYKRWGRKRR